MPSPSSTSSSRSTGARVRRSVLLGVGLLLTAQVALVALDLNSPTFFGSDVVSQKYTEALRYAEEAPIDVVAIGHSHTVNGFDPATFEKLTGLRAYNFGLAGTDMESQAIVLRDFILPELKPRVVLWNLDPVFGDRAVRQSNRHMLNAFLVRMLNSDAFLVQARPGGHALLGVLKDLFLYQKRSVAGWVETIVDPYVRRYDRNGFLPVYTRMGREEAGVEYDVPAEWLERKGRWLFPLKNEVPRSRETVVPPEVDEDEENAWRAEARATVEEALEAARKAGVEVFAFAAPMLRRRFMVEDEFTHEITTEGTGSAAWFAALIEKYDVRFVNYGYYPPISDDVDLYYNDAHLNVYGARDFTARLAHHLFLHTEDVPAELEGFPSDLQRLIMREFRSR